MKHFEEPFNTFLSLNIKNLKFNQTEMKIVQFENFIFLNL